MAEPPAKKRKLPALPDSFSTHPLETDSPAFHQGRIRASPHVVGQWAAHIYLELQPSDSLRRALSRVEPIARAATAATVHSFLNPAPPPISTVKDKNTKSIRVSNPSEPLHLSLSRPLLLQTSQRLELRTAVAAVARETKPFSTRFASFGVLENDERTRRFLGIEIGQGYDTLAALVVQLNGALRKMRLPTYYDTPRFHTSLVWSTTTSANVEVADSPARRTVEDDGATGDATRTAPDEPPTEERKKPGEVELVPFSQVTVEKLEAELGKRLRQDELYVAEMCVKIGKEVKRFKLA